MRDEIGQRQVRALALSKEEVEQSRRLARHLHGTVQAELSATALRGAPADENAAEVALVEGILEASSAALAESPAAIGSHGAEDLRVCIAELASRWAGLMTVEFRVPDDAGKAVAAAGVIPCIMEVISELIHNALHHGNADRVEIWLSLGEGNREVVLVADDNGTGPGSGDVVAGLGSEVISMVASRWALTPHPAGRGSRAEVVIPLPERNANDRAPQRCGD
jgi:signal transduction histidine kinase